jgi:hypothetical protein
MNDSLEKQIRELMRTYRITFADQIQDLTRNINIDFDNLEDDVKEIIENKANLKEL